MGDTQQNKEKSPYSPWTPAETKVLVELLVEGIKHGWRDASGNMNKATVENKILPVLNERIGCNKTHKHYQSRIKYLKSQYQSYLDLQRNSSGFGWDPETKMFTASDEVWNGYFKAHPNHKYMRYDSHDQFEDLKIIFDGTAATGSNAIGLDDTTDACTYRVGDNQVNDNLISCDSGDELSDASPISDKHRRGRAEKLVPRKRSKKEAYNNSEEQKSDNNDSVVTVSNKILGCICIYERYGWIQTNIRASPSV
ncbi:unnamed protein product [Microthlaspi erraticum]|uniref:Myb/SANT-like domain-containing protein n=1 Tax=Microthlaspi erraticum TaxID=1685480 RepID=A0A6D2J1X2_9BRAS|nr:unnamed protein product [Microthlaspi erraticum]